MRVAVIGAGFGERVMAGVYREHGMEVEVVSARDDAAVRGAVAAPVDLVSVHSPPFLHTQHVGLALEHGRNVLCDKPFGRSAADARLMLAAAREAGVVHLLNFEFRQDPTRRALHDVVTGGSIGRPVHLTFTSYTSASRRPLRPFGWLFDREHGGGWIGAFGSHVIDTIRWLMGEIVDARGGCRIDVPERPDRDGTMRRCTAEDAFTAHFRLAGDATATVDTAFAAPVNVAPVLTVIGTDGVAELVGASELRVRRPGERTAVQQFAPFDGDQHLPAMRPWLALVRDTIERGPVERGPVERGPVESGERAPSFEDGVACAEAMDLLRRNAVWPA